MTMNTAVQQLTRAARLRTAVIPLARQIRQRRDDDGLTPTQLAALSAIERFGPLSLSDLAGRERLSLPTISKAVAVLEEIGVVERLADRRDRRISIVQLSEAGASSIARRRQARDAWLAGRLDGLTAEDLEALDAAISVLERIAGADELGSPQEEM